MNTKLCQAGSTTAQLCVVASHVSSLVPASACYMDAQWCWEHDQQPLLKHAAERYLY